LKIKHNQKLLSLTLLALLLLSTTGSAMAAAGEAAAVEVDQEKQAVLKDSMDKINYSVGFQIGNDFQKQRVELRTDSMMRGIMDATQNNKPLLTKGEMQVQLIDLKKRIIKEQAADVEKYRGEDRAFLAENATKEGVVVLESGLQYKVVTSGDGVSPKETDTVRVDYIGTKVDGQEFGSTYREGQPAEFSLQKVVPGIKEALMLMKEGDEWILYLPSDLAFAEQGPLADRAVIFKLKLLKVVDKPAAQ